MRKKTFLFISGGLSALVVILFAVWVYLAYENYQLSADIAVLSATAKEKTARTSYLISAKSFLRESRNDIDLIASRFIEKENLPGFIDRIENKATAYGVKVSISSVNLEDSAKGSTIGKLRMNVTALGNWKNVVEFIAALDSLSYLSSVERVTFTKANAQANQPWSAGATLIQYMTHQK